MSERDIHETVSKAYEEALSKSKRNAGGGCCGPTVPAGTVAKLAGYGEEHATYAEAAASSFGCGNPLAFAGVEPGQTVLDLGSGAGLDLLIAAEKVGPSGRVIGVDMTDAMVAEGQAAAAKAGFETVEVRKGLIEELPVEADSVDWVISNCVINLSPDKPGVFAEIQRVLKPGGRFSISDIVVADLPDALRESAAAYAACIAGAISEEEYLAGLEGAGLEEVAVEERIVYTQEQIRALVASDVDACCGTSCAPDGALEKALASTEVRAWSAKFVGRKAR